MNKKGFTLVELLVVIAIIGVLSVIIVPSVINVNKNVNKRLLDSKKQNISSAATLYASRNDDIFNGVDEVPVFVYELIDMGYVEIDVDKTDSRCNDEPEHKGAKGCVLNPVITGTLNADYVILRKQGATGYYAEYIESDHSYTGQSGVIDTTLATAVCDAINAGKLDAKSENGNQCGCYNVVDYKYTEISEGKPGESPTGPLVNACIISGENPNNYLRYGDSKPNWRVLGVYKIDGVLNAKMITSEPI